MGRMNSYARGIQLRCSCGGEGVTVKDEMRGKRESEGEWQSKQRVSAEEERGSR